MTLSWLAFVPVVAATTLPLWNTEASTAQLKGTDAISFDPLAVLAILWNPRASASASRLYAQPSSKRFRWPHMMQIGAITVPVSVLVNHLTMNYKSRHPAIEMFMGDVDRLKVKSTIGKEINLFTSLPISGGESALIGSLNFKSSKHPANDIYIVSLGNHNPIGGGEIHADVQEAVSVSPRTAFARVVFFASEATMGLLLLCGVIFSILRLDAWAITLFGTYLAHWMVSTAISFCHLIVTDDSLLIRDDPETVYAIYERPSGGWVIFKGPQETMERWARTAWTFSNSPLHLFLHWNWMISGLLASLASVANMVNMDGILQLGFLGTLLYGSVAELWLTVLARDLQSPSMSFLGPCTTAGVYANDKKFKSIVQASMGLDKDNRLDSLRWTALGLLPARDPFLAIEQASADLRETPLTSTSLESLLHSFDERCEDLPREDRKTVLGIRNAIQDVCNQRIEQAQQRRQP